MYLNTQIYLQTNEYIPSRRSEHISKIFCMIFKLIVLKNIKRRMSDNFRNVVNESVYFDALGLINSIRIK